MQKREKVNFANLESVLARPSKTYTDDELLAAIGNPDVLAQKPEAEQLVMVSAIAHQMHASVDFKRKVLEEIDKSLQKRQ